MGDRVSISFKHGTEESPVLFNHWEGMGFVQLAKDYVIDLKKVLATRKSKGTYPLDRLEPGTVMVDFIRHITEDMDRVDSNLYLGKTEADGDNSDNGHFTIDLGK